jgi:hypothetical protein
MPRARIRAVTARCDHCRKPIRTSQGISGPGDSQFDAVSCRKAYLGTLQLKGLQNGVRVARSRFKAGVISRAGVTYRRIGGRDWPLVARLLQSLL